MEMKKRIYPYGVDAERTVAISLSLDGGTEDEKQKDTRDGETQRQR